MKRTTSSTRKNDIPIEDAEVKNRFEIRLKNERAYYAVRDLLVYDNPEHTAFKIINRYIRFVDKDDSKPRSDWKLNEEWAWFIGNNRERLKLTTKPEPYSFQRTLNWLSHQVAPTLKVAIKLDEINQTQVVKDILDHAKLTDRHKQILKQQSVKEQDVITTKNNSNTNSLNIERRTFFMNFGQNLYNWFLSNAQSLVLLAIVCDWLVSWLQA